MLTDIGERSDPRVEEDVWKYLVCVEWSCGNTVSCMGYLKLLQRKSYAADKDNTRCIRCFKGSHEPPLLDAGR
jgi:hypothetical protein